MRVKSAFRAPCNQLKTGKTLRQITAATAAASGGTFKTLSWGFLCGCLFVCGYNKAPHDPDEEVEVVCPPANSASRFPTVKPFSNVKSSLKPLLAGNPRSVVIFRGVETSQTASRKRLAGKTFALRTRFNDRSQVFCFEGCKNPVPHANGQACIGKAFHVHKKTKK